jgi:hypothetical protein
MKNIFPNAEGKEKQRARIRMVDAIAPKGIYYRQKNAGLVLSLPFTQCRIEKMILRRTNEFAFEGCEREEKYYYEMMRTICKYELPIQPFKCLLSDRIYAAQKNQYAHIIADYCGCFDTAAPELEYAIKNNIVQAGGTIAMTFSLRSPVTNILDKMCRIEKYKGQTNTKTEHAIRVFVKTIGKGNYKVETVFQYKDENPEVKDKRKRASMILVIARRVK